MALGQTSGFDVILLRLVGLDLTVPAFGTLSRRQKSLAVNIPSRGPKGPLHVLIDSTGIKVKGEGCWHPSKHGRPKRRDWRNFHLGIDEETLEIRAIEVTSSHIGDAPVLPSRILAGLQIGSVPANGSHDTRNCHYAIANRGAHALIPTHKNPKSWKTITAGAAALNKALRAPKYLGRALWPMERIPLQEPRRNEDALFETAGAAPHGSGLRPPGCGTPGPYRRFGRVSEAVG